MKNRSIFFIGFFFFVVILIFLFKSSREDFLDVMNGLFSSSSSEKGFDTKKYSLGDSAKVVLDDLFNRDFEDIGKYIDDEWIYFLPYPYIDNLENKKSFSSEEMKNLYTDDKKILWWYWDGRWDGMYLSFKDFYQRFVVDHNYTQAPIVLLWDDVVSRGNTSNNLTDFFEQSEIIEYYFTGFDSQYEWMDRRSLYLVFIKEDGSRYLKLIAHGEWTI